VNCPVISSMRMNAPLPTPGFGLTLAMRVPFSVAGTIGAGVRPFRGRGAAGRTGVVAHEPSGRSTRPGGRA
jgi:hypothetical protein